MSSSNRCFPKDTEVLDAAFELAKNAIRPDGEATAKEKLQQMFPECPFDTISELYLRASALAGACYDVGDQCREKLMTNRQAMATLRDRYPGFSLHTYQSALGWGYFLSR